ncbi:MAG: antitoxin VbhA family protein [Oscillospiraceae bacterium]|nr:antitoxin VbhA family protein [Oscillospiraceae bacterium]
MRDIEQKINNVNGSMAIEGMPLTDEDKHRLRLMLRGEVSYEETIKRVKDKYISRVAAAHE